MTPPRMPIMILPSKPRLPPEKILVPSQPAMAPMIQVMTISMVCGFIISDRRSGPDVSRGLKNKGCPEDERCEQIGDKRDPLVGADGFFYTMIDACDAEVA